MRGGGMVWWNLTGTSGDIGAENWDMRGFSTFFRFFSMKNGAHQKIVAQKCNKK